MRVLHCLLPALAALALAACSEQAPDSERASERQAAITDSELTVDRLVASPSLDGPSVDKVAISPDGARVTYLKGKEDAFRVQDLWAYTLESGETRRLVDSRDILGGDDALSEVEKARRERQRIYAEGIVDYEWGPDGEALLIPASGDLFWLPIGGELRRLTETEPAETDAKISPKGNYVSFIREKNLYVIDVETGEERQLTQQGGGTTLMGMAEFVAQEEMKRSTGYWWAPDESQIALTRVDQSPVEAVKRYEIGADGGVTTVEQRYPFAGSENVGVDLGTVSVDGGEIAWLDLGEEEDIYLARVDWLPDSRRLAFQRQSRDQKRLDLVIADLEDGTSETVLTETSETWINLSDDLTFLEDSERFIWSSERSGYRHLYLYDTDGTEIGALTAGDWPVAELERVDEEDGRVYFSASAETPLERHLYSVPLAPDPAAMTRLTETEGWHDPSVGEQGALFVDRFSGPQRPPAVALHRVSGERVAFLLENGLDGDHPYGEYRDNHAAREYGTLTAADGETELFYSLRKPADFDPEKSYPAIVNVYGGPGVQRVRKSWEIDTDQILARKGYLVFKLDNRGATNRGKASEDVLYRAMAQAEVADQVKGASWLAGRPYVDGERVGVYGWSYGGYMTLHLMARARELFTAGMAGAPVTDWRLYDTHYTERYLGKPGESGAYEEASVLSYLDGFADGRLMLVHGMADDNVFFDHSVKLMTALQKARVQFDLMTYPGKRHRVAGEDVQAHLWTDALGFFERRLSRQAGR